jgi:septal ring factor EnvC (AmiA/AmiB activator)
MRHRTVLPLLLALAAGFPTQAETDAAATAARAAEMLEQAGFALLEAEGARDRVEALTQTVRAYEEGLLALREGLRQAALQERSILLVFEAESARLARLLAVLQTIEAEPAPLRLLHPEGALDTARSGMIVADVAPAVIDEARALRRQLEDLAALRQVQDDALDALSAALDRVQEARAQLSQAIADRRSLPDDFTQDSAAMAALLASVESLDDLSARLASDSAAPTDLPDFAAAAGTLPQPVLGRTLRAFRESDAAGVERPGLVIATRPGALVTAPWPGTVRYAGPLLDYGNVIILEPQSGYLLIMAGLGPVYETPGALVTAGAPLGLMPGGTRPADDQDLIAAETRSGGAELSETLYIELREIGTPVNPAMWFDSDGTGGLAGNE